MTQKNTHPFTDLHGQFTRTKTPRMYLQQTASGLQGLLYLPMTESEANNIARWYAYASPVFDRKLPELIASSELSAAKFLSSLLQNHPDQRTGKEKRLDIGYEIRIDVDTQQQKLSTGGCGLLLTYPLQQRHQELIALIRAVYSAFPHLPPAQFHCMSAVGLSAPVIVSVSSHGVTLVDAEVDIFGPERLLHEKELNCYVGHVLYQHPGSANKVPATVLFKAGYGVDPKSALIDTLRSEHDGAQWSVSQHCFILSDGTTIKIIRSERVSCYEFEIIRRVMK